MREPAFRSVIRVLGQLDSRLVAASGARGGIETFLEREVLPHAPDAWYDPESVRTGYEVSFTMCAR